MKIAETIIKICCLNVQNFITLLLKCYHLGYKE
jgi:hypothetical protein